MAQISVNLNGKALQCEVDESSLLSTFLREDCGLTGTHIGCDTSQCGTCVVHVNGQSIKSCSMLTVQADGANVTTIEVLPMVMIYIRCKPPFVSIMVFNADFAQLAW